ncbi:MAG: NAD(P)-dependent dehydrogenase, short-chain alcohol dehydrogenase family [Pseudomonas sp.]|uniref:SDR family NAD(P)-dependent oxidoreductase n=1 Tax=Pseudomonas sp. TaxID=306 RepID=UPI0026200DF0|nr:SDR family oxidoreductase [Pseudomonas sp.]MDB6051743.1 NAD(P)-dependent dehydrogenase, short-chain alcohol dehydrogenase family [Pseudomonas sp.]
MANETKTWGMPSFRLDGKTALITGAGGGIGAGVALAFSGAGADVILVGRTQSNLDEVAHTIRRCGGNVQTIVCDVTDSAAIRTVIGNIPVLDILVNNAGTNFPEPMLDVSDEHLDAMLNLNVKACFVTAQAAVKKMLANTGRDVGVIINVSSQMGHVGSPDRTVYCMTKHAIEGLTKAMAVELAGRGIRVNTLCPTFVDTPLVRKIIDTPEKEAFLVSKIPMGHMAKMEDVVGAALYLAGPSARMVTGTSLKVDGGWTAQ